MTVSEPLIDLEKYFGKTAPADLCYGVLSEKTELTIFLGKSRGMPFMRLLAPVKASKFRESVAVAVTEAPFREGLWSYSLTLKDRGFLDQFKALVYELLLLALSTANARQALRALENRYHLWMEFWKGTRRDLTEKNIEGFYGEISYIEKLLTRKMDPMTVVSGWLGPEEQEKDFMLPKYWAEIKTIRNGKDRVQISSLEQLQQPDEDSRPGRLVVYTVELMEAPEGESLLDLIERVVKLLEGNPDAREFFKNTLQKSGIQSSDPKLKSLRFRQVGVKEYSVTEHDFPSITRAKVPPAVMTATYSLYLGFLDNWQIKD